MCEIMENKYFENLLLGSYSKKTIYGGVRWELKTLERLENDKALERYGYKVYSQNDEDGIIEEIFSRIGTTNKKFIEFGLQNGLESNTHYLLHKGWSGLWIEGSSDYCDEIESKFTNLLRNGKLKLANRFITVENINDIFLENNITGEIDLLSIDIDGNDYHIMKAINVVKPRVIMVEYNAKFSPDYEWYMPYDAEHIWDETERYGASLKAYELLGRKLGYELVGTNLTGYNAFFVREDLTKELFLKPATAENLYNPMRKNLMFECAHPSKGCVAEMREGIGGVLDFYPNDRYVSLYGFNVEEKYNESTLRWMNGYEGKIIVRSNNQERIILKCVMLDEKLFGKYVLHIDGDNIITQDIVITKAEQEIEIILKDKVEAVSVIFRVDSMWKPGNGDSRTLGVGIIVR